MMQPPSSVNLQANLVTVGSRQPRRSPPRKPGRPVALHGTARTTPPQSRPPRKLPVKPRRAFHIAEQPPPSPPAPVTVVVPSEFCRFQLNA
ncbi:hypothetical protein L484_012029 [Morus notabilis]|uniref:Uncharacterized protein n=1 Tax=Morus notabilis TaxID=981085 RepID=W9R295_9ROSA|nr:hypothetical protein L484_012029 [Morus notabilis]